MIEIEKSRNGELTAKIGNHHLHSSYSPIKESKKILNTENLGNYTTFILLEPCLNYIGLLLKQHNPHCKILSIYLNNDFYDLDRDISDSKFIFNEKTQNLKCFLGENLTELDIEGLKIVEWNPSAVYFRETIKIVKTVVGQQIRELYGNITTISGFGRTQFKNFIKNYISINKIGIPEKTNLSTFIAGSGPSLKNDIDFLKQNRKNLILIGLPSSLHYLKHSDITPDFIISTDPGYYAGIHLKGFENIPIIAPYSAQLPSSIYNNIIIPVRHDYFPENKIFSESDSYIRLPQNGTVAGSAVFFAHLLTSSKILISGLDFSFIDILSHIRPHTFDSLIEKHSGRLNTSTTLYFDRNIPASDRLSSNRRTSKALKTYAGWFASNSSYLSDRCFFLNYHTTPPGSFKSITKIEAENILRAGAGINIKIIENNNEEIRRTKVKHYLDNSKTDCMRILKDCRSTLSSAELFNLLNNEMIFNFFLPDLLQFKRRNINSDGKESQKRAVSIVEKTITFLEGFFNYVQ